MSRIVVDANVAVKWFSEEVHSPQAHAVLESPDELIGPDILLIEATNTFLKKLRRGEMETAAVRLAIEALPRHVVTTPITPFFDRAVSIAVQHSCTLYDALYVQFALLEGCQLVTADIRLINGLQRTFGETLAWLGDVPIA